MELETFKITVLPLRDKLINFSLRLMQEKADAEDIVQEAFLKLWYIREKLDKLRARRPEGPDIETLSLDSGYRSPAEQLEQQDAATRIRQLISQLPAVQQTIIRMKDVEGYEIGEIAEITGSQVEAIRSNLSRARKKIREQFLLLNKQEQL